MKCKTMDVAITWLLVVGPLLIAVGLAVWGFVDASRTLALWVGFGGCALLLVAGALQLQKIIWEAPSAIAYPTKQDMLAIEQRKARAYVSVTDATITDAARATPPTASVTITNTGETPAMELTWRVDFAITKFPFTEKDTLDRTRPAPKTTLGSGKSLSYTWTFDKWKPEWGPLIAKGGVAVWITGEVEYLDAFGAKRHTYFRLYHGGDSYAPPGKFSIAPEGNSAD